MKAEFSRNTCPNKKCYSYNNHQSGIAQETFPRRFHSIKLIKTYSTTINLEKCQENIPLCKLF